MNRRGYRPLDGQVGPTTTTTTGSTGSTGSTDDCADWCANGVNSLGRCEQEPDDGGDDPSEPGEVHGWRWWVHPSRFLRDVFATNATAR